MSENREELEARIAAYIDGQLSPAEAARLEVFLANTDPQLAEQIIGMLADRHDLRALPRPKAPGDLVGRVMDQVERATLLNDVGHLEHSPRPWWQAKGAIAAGLILLIGGFLWVVAMSVIGSDHGNKFGRLANNSHKEPAATVGPLASAQREAGKEGIFDAGQGGRKDVADGDRAAVLRSVEKGAAGEKVKEAAAALGPVAAGPGLPPALAPAIDDAKSLEKAEKNEQVVNAQLARNRDVVQNGQAAAAKLGYAAVDSPERALANISNSVTATPPDPIVITMVARDATDYARLKLSLEEVMNQDPGAARMQAGLQARYVNVLNNSISVNVSNGSYANSANTITNDAATNAGNIGVKGQSISGVVDDLGKASAGKPKAAGASDAPTGLDVSARAVKSAQAAGQGTVAENCNAYKFYSPKQRTFEEIPGPAAAADAPAAPAAATAPANLPAAPAATATGGAPLRKALADRASEMKSVAHGEQTAADSQSQVLAQGVNAATHAGLVNGRAVNGNWLNPAEPVYRVALRPEQIEQLASQFRVDSITCGRQAYVITPEAYNEKGDKSPQGQLAIQSHPATQLGDNKHADLRGASAAPASRPSSGAAATPATLDSLKDVPPQNKETQKSVTTRSQAYMFDRAAAARKDSRFVEVIITMEPPPAATTRP